MEWLTHAQLTCQLDVLFWTGPPFDFQAVQYPWQSWTHQHFNCCCWQIWGADWVGGVIRYL